MKLYGTIAVHVRGEDILRRPGLFDRVRRAFGGDPDLRTGRVRTSLEATAVVDAVHQALRTLGVSNAISLVIDDLTLFHDRERTPGDLGDLFLAFHEHAAAVGGGFGILRLVVEHQEVGVHHVIEIQARGEHAADAAAARMIISSRIEAFTPLPGEAADAYRNRVEPLTRDSATVNLARASFESFVARARDAVQSAMPEARVEVTASDLRIEKAAANATAPRRERRTAPDDEHYDPHEAQYPNPMFGMLSMMLWSSLLTSMMLPNVTVVDAGNAPLPENELGADSGAGDASWYDGGDDAAGAGDRSWLDGSGSEDAVDGFESEW